MVQRDLSVLNEDLVLFAIFVLGKNEEYKCEIQLVKDKTPVISITKISNKNQHRLNTYGCTIRAFKSSIQVHCIGVNTYTLKSSFIPNREIKIFKIPSKNNWVAQTAIKTDTRLVLCRLKYIEIQFKSINSVQKYIIHGVFKNEDVSECVVVSN